MRIIKIPYSEGSLGRNPGAKKGPDKIVEQLKLIYSSESGNVPKFEIDKVDIPNANIVEAQKKIYEKLLKEKDCIALGGDHSVTYSCFKAFASKFKNPGLLIFDSHPDCAPSEFPVTHEDFVYKLIEEGILKKENVVLVGDRNIEAEELEYIEKKKLRMFSMKMLYDNVENICDGVMEMVKDFDGLYLSLDIDVLDPAFAPGTGTPESGGLSSRELIYFVQRLKKLKNLRMADIVEVNPEKDVNDMTSKVAAKLIFELS